MRDGSEFAKGSENGEWEMGTRDLGCGNWDMGYNTGFWNRLSFFFLFGSGARLCYVIMD